MRHTLSDKQIDVVQMSIAGRDKAAEIFCGFCPTVALTELIRATDEGFLSGVQICVDDEPHYAVWYNLTIDGGFHLNCLTKLIQHPAGLVVVVNTIHALATHLGAKFIQFHTKSAALIRAAKFYGYGVDSICVRKTL